MSVSGDGKTSVGRTPTRNTPLMIRGRVVESRRGSGCRRPVAGSVSRVEIRVLHRALDAAVERHAEDVGEAEVVAAPADLVVERGRERREEAAAALHVAANRVALRVGERGRVGEDQQPEPIEAIRREERLVHQLERHARFDERVIHAEHVVLGAIARRDAGVIGLGLFRVQHARRARAGPRCAGSARGRSATGRCARRPAASGGRRGRRRTS